jgi:lambda repressor-like predicted transcriptional regulator
MKIKDIFNEAHNPENRRGPNLSVRHLTPDVVADFNKGLTLTQIGNKYNLHNVTLRNMLRWALGDAEFQRIMDYRVGKGVGIKVNTPNEVIQQMAQMFAQGRTMAEISKHFNIHTSSIHRYLTALPNYKELIRQNQIRQGRL